MSLAQDSVARKIEECSNYISLLEPLCSICLRTSKSSSVGEVGDLINENLCLNYVFKLVIL